MSNADSGSCGSHGISSYLGCGFPQKDAAKVSAPRRLGGVGCSPCAWMLSTEMNAKTAAPSDAHIEFRDASYRINDIPARAIVSNVSLTIHRGETIVLL